MEFRASWIFAFESHLYDSLDFVDMAFSWILAKTLLAGKLASSFLQGLELFSNLTITMLSCVAFDSSFAFGRVGKFKVGLLYFLSQGFWVVDILVRGHDSN